MKKTFIPPEFREKYSELLGSEAQEFLECCNRKAPKTIWVNSLKARPKIIAKQLRANGWELGELEIHENAFALSRVQKPGQSREFKEGLFNLQEKASMVPAIVLDPEPRETVLDAAAAPGNKTLQLACIMNSTGRIIAVDKNLQRSRSLRHNVKKFGMKSVAVKTMDITGARKKEIFDRVLLDAPCSSEGLVRSDFDALRGWSQELVEKKAGLQKKMASTAFRLLKKGGTLVYSTCSFSPEEDEEVMQSLFDSGRAEVEAIKVKGFRIREGITRYNGKEHDSSLKKCARIYPQDNDTQQFFVAKIRKT